MFALGIQRNFDRDESPEFNYLKETSQEAKPRDFNSWSFGNFYVQQDTEEAHLANHSHKISLSEKMLIIAILSF